MAEPRDENLTIRSLGPGDAALLDNVAPEVFDFAVDPDLTAEFLDDPRHHLAVALIGGTVVGMASAVDYVHPDKPRELWINEIAVTPAHQRSGIAQGLLRALFSCGRQRGCREAWVGTGHDNEAAQALYASLNGRDESFLLYSFRIGEDVRL